MKGDFTRSTFKSDKHYSSVRMQQGRVQLDADWNEQMDINLHRIEKEASDLIGPCGAPLNEEESGFKIGANGNNLTISRGSIYVDGILCDNPESINITDQEDLPDFKNFNTFIEGTYLAYLDVWQRHITVIEDQQIREVALGGPDTATRTKTVWQVKLEKLKKDLKLETENEQIDCKEVSSGWKAIIDRKIEKRDAKLAAFTKQETPGTNPCIIPAGAGYRRLENQLYRVEIYEGGNLSKATFTWSRDNGSVVFAIEEFLKDASGNLTRFKIKQPGKDKSLSLATGDWVEILDDATELSENKAGMLAQITESPDVLGRIFGLNQSISGYDMNRHPRVRRWDQKSGAISVTPKEGDSIELEDGIWVKFSGNNFRVGDYWLIPARTATENTQETGKIEWPQDESKIPPEPKAMPPEGIEHQYCLLAVVQLATSQGSNKWTTTDCRKVFPAVTELTSFFHVSGDGQEAMPGEELPLPLQVGVSNGKWPVENAFVRFEIISGDGKLSAKNPVRNNPLIVKTDSKGIAECKWKLGILDFNNPNVPPSQLVEARLLDVCNDTINTPIRFNANFSVASQVAYTLPDCIAFPITCNVTDTKYQYWNEKYPVIKLVGENFVPLLANADPIWKSHVNKLAEIVLDSNEKYTIRTNEQLGLGEGYAIKARQIDVDGEKVWLEFTMDGELVYDEIISVFGGSENTWEVKLDNIQGEDKIVVFRVHISQVFQGAVDSVAQIDGLWLIDYSNARTLQIGDRLGAYKLIKIIGGTTESDMGSLVFESNKDFVNGFPTVKRLLEKKTPSWPPANKSGNVSVKGILDSFLCDFNASHLPLDNELCSILSNAGVKTVQDALNVLCKEIVGGDEGGCCIVVADTEQLLKALDELKEGSTICLLAGEFKVERLLIENLNNIAIRGCNHASKLIGIIGIVNCQNLVIENLDISGSVYVESAINFSLKNNQITQAESPCLEATNCSGVVIESNLFTIKGKRGLVFKTLNDLKIHMNRINIDFLNTEIDQASSIYAARSSDIEITNNLIQISGDEGINERTTVVGILLGEVEREIKGSISVVSNTVNSINSPSLYIHSRGPVRVHGNTFKSTLRSLGESGTEEGSTVNIESPDDQIIFTDNLCYSHSIKGPVNDNYVYLIGIKGKDAIFSNNTCDFLAKSYEIQQITTHVYIHIPPEAGSVANVIGNRCSENMLDERVFSIFAGETPEFFAVRRSILLGNITRNRIGPEPQDLNLRG